MSARTTSRETLVTQGFESYGSNVLGNAFEIQRVRILNRALALDEHGAIVLERQPLSGVRLHLRRSEDRPSDGFLTLVLLPEHVRPVRGDRQVLRVQFERPPEIGRGGIPVLERRMRASPLREQIDVGRLRVTTWA
jgi:hypothetical protein